LVQLSLGKQGGAEGVVGLRGFRVDLDGLAAFGDGLVQLPLFEQGVAEVIVGLGIVQAERNGLPVAGG
jgi:hypothetical protein